MERLRPPEGEVQEKRGFSLKELVTFEIERRKRKRGMRVSQRVIWLSEAMEGEDFWINLASHIDSDNSKRQSLGGIFKRDAGEKQVGSYTWDESFSSLDGFLRLFDMRATEFIFRDFRAKEQTVEERMDAIRQKAFDKYPRVRRIYWDDYQELLNSPVFWRNLALDLSEIRTPVRPNIFFGWPKRHEGNKETNMEKSLHRLFLHQRGQPGREARSLQYHNLTQIIRDLFHKNPIDFLLSFYPDQDHYFLLADVNKAKQLLDKKLLRPNAKIPIEKMTKEELENLVKSRSFWEQLIKDVEEYRDSQADKALSLSAFLSYYSREKNKLAGRGDYTVLAGAFRKEGENFRKQLPVSSRRLAYYLMWKVQPTGDTRAVINQAKDLCAEIFPNDCLYVGLQTLKFWSGFLNDTRFIKGKPSFYTFLRYFSEQNPSCDARKNRPSVAKYQKFLHRSYHEPEDLKDILGLIGMDSSDNYWENLIKIFWQTCPDEYKNLLERKFYSDFSVRGREEKQRQETILSYAKAVIIKLKNSDQGSTDFEFSDEESAEEFKKKLRSVSRSLKTNLMTKLEGRRLMVALGSRLAVPLGEREKLERRVKRMRLTGLENQEIARRLRVKDHTVEWIVTKLIKQGKISSRR